ncbi:luciferin 4-monooxygenase-like [Leptopilina boulardi]|uniref:luciferin 4-monooxygenase-like n=1 Tax=Leptopilina boulardi TaxID=63433 RepID=UPI0021F69A25|nr:luciferin 4-monooxygenase-like [Leptopilina boulardi]XP_051166633.1 luciferin 4-monooxygenase-like [Leptopilina boulardi]
MANILSGPPFLNEWNYKSMAEFLYEKITLHASSTALISMETKEELSYKEFLEKSLKLSVALEKMGLKVNDKIGICSENNLNFCIALLASIFLGVTICPLNPAYTEQEFIHVLKISKPKYIFVSTIIVEKMMNVVDKLSWSPKLILLNDKSDNFKILRISNLIANITNVDVKNFQFPIINKNEHILLIACSSGTTGLPKGVMLSDKNFLIQLQYYVEDRFPFFQNAGSFLGLLPMFHGYGFFIFLVSLTFGNKIIVMSRFDERLFLQAVQDYRIKTLPLVPPLLVFLAKSPIVDEFDLSCVKQISCGAAPVSENIKEAVQKKFKLPFIRNGYGLTETTVSLMNSCNELKSESVGILRPGLKAKVISIDGNSNEPLGPNREGELCFKGEIIMKGYYGDEKATRAAIDEDGFLHTGDVGYYDEDGCFFIVDRVKELIKYKGFQVPPAELEAILLTHPAIKDAAVIGMPDEVAGELPLAFVVKQSGVNVSPREIIQYVNERVSSHKRLRAGVRFIEAIPKNPSGKILRRELRNILKSKI